MQLSWEKGDRIDLAQIKTRVEKVVNEKLPSYGRVVRSRSSTRIGHNVGSILGEIRVAF